MKRFNSIIKSPNDTLTYRAVELSNKLVCLLIQDPETKVSATAMKVCTGSFNDPKEFQGLAHFLEHMLFMGSEKFPSSDKYREFVNENGGSCNAYTTISETVFHHYINNSALIESLDIFSSFFIKPLLDAKFVNKELEAVNSEHQKDINNDFWREVELGRYLSRPEAPLKKFQNGNF